MAGPNEWHYIKPEERRMQDEKEIEEQLKLFRYLAKDRKSARWLQVNSPEEIPDALFQVVPYDEQKCIEQGIIEIKTEEEYNKIFYPSGKVE